jgi:hypothetical protein
MRIFNLQGWSPPGMEFSSWVPQECALRRDTPEDFSLHEAPAGSETLRATRRDFSSLEAPARSGTLTATLRDTLRAVSLLGDPVGTETLSGPPEDALVGCYVVPSCRKHVHENQYKVA